MPDEKNILGNYILEKSKELEYAYHPDLSIKSMWVNFQKKYEYNPMHLHDGVMSFVIWMKIPYRYEDEMQHETAKKVNSCMNGSFEFIYTNLLGAITGYQYSLSPEAEGGVLIFPSALHHVVHPFYTSDEERISISGNIG